MASSVAKVKREKVGQLLPMEMTCPLCNEILKEPIAISVCLHTFCRKCVYEKLSNGGVNGCPICEIGLACVSPNKLRLEHNLQDIISSIFPSKKRKIDTLEVSSSPKVKKEKTITSLVISTPTVSRPSEKVITNTEILSIEWQKCSVLKKMKLEDLNYYLGRNISFHDMLTGDFNKPKLDVACHWIQNAVDPPQLSKQMIENSFPDIFKCIIYYVAHFLAYNRARVSNRFEENEEDSHTERCGCDHESKLKEQSDFYEAKLKEQAHHYESKIKSLESFDREKVKEESHRAGMEEGVRRVVRAIHAAAPYVEWNRIHISEDTTDEDRVALHRAYAEGMVSSSPPATLDEDKGHIIIF